MRLRKSWTTKFLVGTGAVLLAWAWAFGISQSRQLDPQEIVAGRDIFTHEWTPNDPRSPNGDGLGPVFNANSCKACHFLGGVGGAGPNSANVQSFEVHPHEGSTDVKMGVVHAATVSPDLLETKSSVLELFPGSTIKQSVDEDGKTADRRGPSPVHFMRLNTPPLFGVGQIDAISDRAILKARSNRNYAAMAREFRGDFTSTPVGKVREVDGSLGKFGWKGQFASVEKFVAVACAMEMGLTNPLVAQAVPREHREDTAAGLDIDRTQLDSLVAFVEALPRPEQILPQDEAALSDVRRGEAVFASIGCADCHTPDVGNVRGVYSDFLLYSLEDDSKGDGGSGGGYGPPPLDPFPWPEDVPVSTEWQTPPLWGVADSAPYFHDGASPTLESAIARHLGAAKHVTKRYRSLSAGDKSALLSFLKTLRAPRLPADAPVVQTASLGARD